MGSRFDRLKATIFNKLSRKNKVNEEKRETAMPLHLSEDAKKLVQTLFEELGPRPAATKESRKAARKIASIFEEYTENVTITSARIYTSVFKGIMFSILLSSPILFILTLFNLPIMAILVIFVWCFSLYLEMKGKRNILKTLMPSDEAANVHAVMEPDDLVEETIVFSAHHDSAPENRANKIFSLSSFSAFIAPGIGMAMLLITSISQIIYDATRASFSPQITIGTFIVSSLIGMVFAFISIFDLKTAGKVFVPGAGDNLSGISVIVEILRYFSSKRKNGTGLKHTRLIFVSFDGEECGLQGSKAWYKNNSKLLHNARILNFDGIYKAEDLAFLTQDGNGLVPLSTSLASRCAEIASSMGYRIDVGKLGIMAGETDAASAALSGYKATTLTSMRPEVRTPAHTMDDTPDKIEVDALGEAISVGIKLAELEDEDWCKDKNNEVVSFLDYEKKYKLTR